MNVRKRIFVFVSALFFGFYLSGCGASEENQEVMVERSDDVQKPETRIEQEVMCFIRITMEDIVLQGILYDNPTARGFAEMLPLTVDLWHPAPDFARAFDLPDRIAAKGTPGRGYELGSLAYWDAGPSIAVIYKASREETVVPVVPIGKITSDVSLFEEYGRSITIEAEEDMEPAVSSEGNEEQGKT